MGLIDNLRNGIVSWLAGGMSPEASADEKRAKSELTLREYFAGIHPRQMTVKSGEADDNITLSFTTLVVDRTVSRLFGAPITFDLPGEETTPQDETLAKIWNANKQAILLHKLAQFGAIYGHCYVKIVPEGVESQAKENELLPRLVALNPLYMRMDADPTDLERIIRYVLQFTYQLANGDRESRREITELVTAAQMIATARVRAAKKAEADYGQDVGAREAAIAQAEADAKPGAKNHWEISRSILRKDGNWMPDGETEVWEYEFAPIVSWQNLPLADSIYGQSDIEGILELQDRINFCEGNIGKIIRHHAHPHVWLKGAQMGDRTEWGPENYMSFKSEGAEVKSLEMSSDLASSRAFGLDLRQSLFDISRTVDITSIVDKIGQVTNLGLRILFKDEMDKLASKRLLYGDALAELNRRLLILSGFTGADADGGVVIWPDPLPTDEMAKAQALQVELGMGTVSKETIATELGRDWAQEEERIAKQGAATTNLGAAILKTFNRGG